MRSASGYSQVRVGLGLEHQFHAQRLAARLQDVEQLLAPDAHEPMAARAHAVPLEVQLDVVPVVERHLDLVGGGGVPLAHVVHRRVREHHAPAEGVVGRLRSTTVTRWSGSSFFISSPKYRPAGPPPMHTIRMA
jgi:hypothetical protein